MIYRKQIGNTTTLVYIKSLNEATLLCPQCYEGRLWQRLKTVLQTLFSCFFPMQETRLYVSVSLADRSSDQ